jgi:TonB family protein
LSIFCLVHAAQLEAQGQSAQLTSKSRRIESALVQLRARHVDSATTLLQEIINSSGKNSGERAEGLFWLGVARFYQGEDSAAASAFRSSLQINSSVTSGGSLAILDSALAGIWESELTRAVCGEDLPGWLSDDSRDRRGNPMNAAARRIGTPPELTSRPRLRYPDELRAAGIQGRVLVRVIVDATGRTERGSIRILESADHGFDDVVIGMARDAEFTTAKLEGAPVRYCAVVPVDFKIKR